MSSEENKVNIILAFYNGNKYLREQLGSIVHQSQPVNEILIIDDCSPEPIDMLLLAPFKEKVTITIKRNRKNRGYASNFLNGLFHFKDQKHCISYSDQDDIWLPNKLARGKEFLDSLEENIPGLYCCRTKNYDDKTKSVAGVSPLFTKAPSFKNAVVQNIAGGNTMLFNETAAQIIRKSIENASEISCVSHDWWTYIIISGAGGSVLYDKEANVLYRQHGGNVIGSNSSFGAKFRRLNLLLAGEFRKWNSRNLEMLSFNRDILTAENVKILDEFQKARNAPFLLRCYYLFHSGIYRQTFIGSLALYFSALLKRM